MKKLMLMALMALGASTSFAGDSDALKAIMSAKTFVEAENLVKSNLSQLANNEEKAKAYNKLVDLAMQKVNKEQTIIEKNMLSQQLKQGEQQQYDTVGYYDALYHAINAAIEADKYDMMPNAKGKIKPKFHKENQNRLYNLRPQLINAGQDAGTKNDQQGALKNFGLYVSSSQANLFKDVANKPAYDQYLGEVARVAAVYAFQDKKVDLANQYADVALQDTAKDVHKEALNLKSYLITQGLTSKSDSLKAIESLKELYVKEKGNEQVFSALSAMYNGMDNKEELNKLVASKLQEDPNNFSALAMKAQIAMNAGQWDEAIEGYKKAVAVNDKDALVYTYLGFCINSKAQGLNNAAEQKKLYTESVGYLEKARDLDPDKSRANWSYPLYQCYYSLYGAEDSRTKEMENLNK
jgi:hypothetical protein